MKARLLVLLAGPHAERMLAAVAASAAALREANASILLISHEPVLAPAPEGVEVVKLETPHESGYGGNRKLGFRFAIERGFDVVACSDPDRGLGDLAELLRPLESGECAAVIASGPGRGTGRTLALIQRRLLGIRVAGFHGRRRAYSVDALKKIPFERNSDDIRFDTEILIQLHAKELAVKELPDGAHAGVAPGLAWKLLRSMLRAAFHRKALFYDRKFDVEAVEETYDLKMGFPSSHTMAVDSVRPGAAVLDLGCGRGYVAREMAKRARRVTAADRYEAAVEPGPNLDFQRWDLDGGDSPVDVSRYDQIFMLDIIEHLKDPEDFLEKLRAAAARTRPEIILTTANIAFFVTRVMLLCGHFNYGRKGILDRTHTRLFTVNSLRELMEQTGYTIEQVRGIPAPYARVLGLNWMSRVLAWVNIALIQLSPGIFSYQIFIRARAKPTVHNLLREML